MVLEQTASRRGNGKAAINLKMTREEIIFFCRILMRTLKQCSVTRRSANREKKVKAREKEKLQEPFHQIPNIFYFLKLRASDTFLYRKINFFSPPEIYSTIPCLVTLLVNVLLWILQKEKGTIHIVDMNDICVANSLKSRNWKVG